MLHNRINGLLAGAVCAAILAGCSSSRDPFANRIERPAELCLNDYSAAANPQDAFGNRQVMRYVVKKGDTLWDISKRFLVMPWYWKNLWYDNPQIRNPHLIYPGDVLSVVSLNGEKRITITEGNGMYHGTNTGRRTKDGRAIYKYKPGYREYNLNDGPITIAGGKIAPFLLHSEVMSNEQIKAAPVLFGDAGDYLTLTEQQTLYTQNPPAGVNTFKIYRTGNKLIDYGAASESKKSHKNRLLGYQMNYVGQVSVTGTDVETGLTKLTLDEAVQAVQEGDILVPLNAHENIDYFPKLPSGQCSRGFMIANTNTATTMIKEFDTVITGFGRDNGAQVGDIWKIQRPGPRRVINGKHVNIPGKDIGYLMIIRVYDRYSMGFVLDSSQNIDLTDWLVRP